MTGKLHYPLIALFITCAFALNACGSAAANQSLIATSVAMTVQAQDTQAAKFTATAPLATAPITPLPTGTALATLAPSHRPGNGSGWQLLHRQRQLRQ